MWDMYIKFSKVYNLAAILINQEKNTLLLQVTSQVSSHKMVSSSYHCCWCPLRCEDYRPPPIIQQLINHSIDVGMTHDFFKAIKLKWKSVRPSKIFFGPYFSATIDGRNLIFSHKLHIGVKPVIPPFRAKNM
jgi:hypothetical protein